MNKKHKYFAKKTVYNGIEYPSQLEARTAQRLDLMRRATNFHDRVTKVERQHEFVLIHPPIKYKADFLVHFADGRIEVWEAKGFETKEWRKRKKLMAQQFPHILVKVITK